MAIADPDMRPVDELPAKADGGGILHSFVHTDLGRRLRQYYPEVAAVDPGSPLGAVLERQSIALDASDASRQLPSAFKDDMISLVPRLRRYALSLTFDGNEADDLVQLTLLKAWEHRGRFQPGTSLVAWLFTILRNSFINGRRKRSRELPDPDGAYAAILAEPARQDHALELRDLQAAISRLDPAHREALMLVAVDGLPYDAAAMVIGCPAGTVKSRVSRARDRLLQELGATA